MTIPDAASQLSYFQLHAAGILLLFLSSPPVKDALVGHVGILESSEVPLKATVRLRPRRYRSFRQTLTIKATLDTVATRTLKIKLSNSGKTIS
ncbi:hypothetical protein C8Q79DRAFT_989329 [Trametes meyenii]|nr:hypothetical protein C8Q79DRAFT_989329 [Trametes meyenii]